MGKSLLKVILFISLISIGWEAFGQTQTITATGPSNFTVPHGVTSLNVSIWGAGGGGGFNLGNKGAAGGGGGAFLLATGFPVVSGEVFTYNIGNGGQGQSNTTASTNGAPTSFGTLTANGGNRGNSTTAGIGGTAGTGIYFYREGGNSSTPLNSGNSPGSGGGAAGSSLGNGAIGNNLGIGGTGLGGAGSGGAGGTSGTAAQALGKNGIQPGGGGGGEGGDGFSGGNGGNGQISISWTCSNTRTSAANTTIQTVCSGSNIVNITYNIVGAYGASFSNLPPGITGSYSNGLVTISGAPNASATGNTYNYTVTPIGSCTSSIANGTITVSANNSASTISSSTFCQSSAFPAGVTQTTTGATGIGIPSGLPNGITASWAANQIVFSGTPTSFGSFPYSVPLTGGCGSINATGTLTINEITSIKSQNSPGGTTCINGVAFSQMSIGTGFGYTYQWYSNNTPDYDTPNLISGATSNSYVPPSNVAGTTYYYVIVSSPSCSSVTSPVSAAYIVTPNNSVTPASASPLVCVNSAITPITHTTTGATGIGSATGLPIGITPSWSGNTITISGTPSISGVFNYSIPLSGGCGAINATGTITVNAQAAINSPSLIGQTRCVNQAFSPISVATQQGLTYQWFSNDTPDYITPNLISGATSNSYIPPSASSGTTYYYVVVTSLTCGTTATSSLSGALVVNPLPVVSFTVEPTGTQCVDSNVTYETQAGQLNYAWTIPGVAGTDYSIVSGGSTGSNTLTLQWLTSGNKAITVSYLDVNGCGSTAPATSSSLTVQKNMTTASSDAHPSSCFINRTITPFTHTTTLATGIANAGISGANGLPLGLSAAWSGGTITISGTVAASVSPGIYPYSIPLTGGCGTVAATGFIDVQPEYAFESITSVSPSNIGGTASVRFNVDSNIVPDGIYEVTYSLGLANSGGGTTSVTINNGVGIFSSIAILSEDLTSLTITQIKKVTDDCFVPLLENNITFFGIRSAVYPTNGTFYVPAGIYEITIKVWGGGGAGGKDNSNGAGGGGGGYTEVTIPVVPGEIIGLFIGTGGTNQGNGGVSYATRDSSDPNPQSSSLAFASGGLGAIGQTRGAGGTGQTENGALGGSHTGSAGGKGGNGGGTTGGQGGDGGTGSGNNAGKAGETPGGGGGGSDGNSSGGSGGQGLILISYPLPPVSPCFKVIDDGAISGTTIIQFTCDNTWTAPEGLAEFSSFIGGAGGGGGSGFGSGGGGSGGITTQSFISSQPYGLPANSFFDIVVGEGGLGGISQNRGSQGEASSITGIIDGSTISAVAAGGGSGGSGNSLNGGNGAAGGGGAATSQFKGNGGSSASGNSAGNGDNKDAMAFAGGGGAGLGGPGLTGKAAGGGQGEGGDGGAGISLTMGDSIRYFGGGGGGIGDDFNGAEKVGKGGKAPNEKTLGGNGNLDGTNPVGGAGLDQTGSGGGAGYYAGGKGGDGVVYIYYFNYRILAVEYLYFEARYNSSNRSGELSWATAQEWENSHFEIEKAVNDVGTWTKIGEVKGQGYSDTTVEYKFTDTDLPASGGNIFYRLKQVDLSGDFNYSVTRSIQTNRLKGMSNWIIYPNPSSPGDFVKVDLLDRSNFKDEQILIKISDVKGVFQIYSVSSIEEVSIAVNKYLEQAAPGIHIVQLIWGVQSEQLKILRR
ncbi:beta strand repeat-containing protein [Algoriphagus resistens]|uniref:beta strand repeat-containing protein n=1 Tax=Algoriphagus resistens TaxID=1750590 RepID=UPI0007169321|nr:hypothetical protein [Algoriphagus resistens]